MSLIAAIGRGARLFDSFPSCPAFFLSFFFPPSPFSTLFANVSRWGAGRRRSPPEVAAARFLSTSRRSTFLLLGPLFFFVRIFEPRLRVAPMGQTPGASTFLSTGFACSFGRACRCSCHFRGEPVNHFYSPCHLVFFSAVKTFQALRRRRIYPAREFQTPCDGSNPFFFAFPRD